MTPNAHLDVQVTEEECSVLRTAERDGYVAAKLFDHGDFSEEGFLFFGKLEVMCLKGLLRFVDRAGENERAPGDVRMVFAPIRSESACRPLHA